MTEEELTRMVTDHPTLYHMAERGSWASIRQHGLLSTSALLDLLDVTGRERESIESSHRPASVKISRKGVGSAVIRDQKPMDDRGLERCLQDGLTPRDWYELLNARVFFWLSKARLIRLLTARAYRDAEHDVLEIDTAAMIHAHHDTMTLAPINTGATKPMPAPRGRSTIVPWRAYDYEGRRASHPREPVVELAIAPGVKDIAGFTKRVIAMRGENVTAQIWQR